MNTTECENHARKGQETLKGEKREKPDSSPELLVPKEKPLTASPSSLGQGKENPSRKKPQHSKQVNANEQKDKSIESGKTGKSTNAPVSAVQNSENSSSNQTPPLDQASSSKPIKKQWHNKNQNQGRGRAQKAPARPRAQQKGQIVKGQMVQDLQQVQGANDALREKLYQRKQQEKIEEKKEKEKEKFLHWLFSCLAFERDLLLFLYELEITEVWTESVEIAQLLFRAATKGMHIDVTWEAEVLIGRTTRKLDSFAMWIGPGSKTMKNSYYFDQAYTQDEHRTFFESFSRPWKALGEGVAYVRKDGNPNFQDQYPLQLRWSTVEMESAVNINTLPHEETIFEYDHAIEKYISAHKVYHEGCLNGIVFAVEHSDSRPSYIQFFPSLLHETILYAMKCRGELVQQRITYAPRHSYYDLATAEWAAKITPLGVPLSTNRIYEQIAPTTARLVVKGAEKTAKVTREVSSSIKQKLDDKLDDVRRGICEIGCEAKEALQSKKSKSAKRRERDRRARQRCRDSQEERESRKHDDDDDQDHPSNQTYDHLRDLLSSSSKRESSISQQVEEEEIIVVEEGFSGLDNEDLHVADSSQQASLENPQEAIEQEFEEKIEELMRLPSKPAPLPHDSTLRVSGVIYDTESDEGKGEEEVRSPSPEVPNFPILPTIFGSFASDFARHAMKAARPIIKKMDRSGIAEKFEEMIDPSWPEYRPEVVELYYTFRDRAELYPILEKQSFALKRDGVSKPFLHFVGEGPRARQAPYLMRTSSRLYVSIQECAFSIDASFVPFNIVWDKPGYDKKRIEIEGPRPILPTTTVSEVYYSMYFLTLKCFGQDFLAPAIVLRLGKIGVPNADPNRMEEFLEFCSEWQVPTITDPQDVVCSTTDYDFFLQNMPPASRKKHLQFFEVLRTQGPASLDLHDIDSVFVKHDEVIFSEKGRMIVNPNPYLFYRLVSLVTGSKKAWKNKMFHKVYDAELRIYFTYGADLTPYQKAYWYGIARQMVSLKANSCFCMVGGDDNIMIINWRGKIFVIESDVNACDQSHNEYHIKALSAELKKQGFDDATIEVFRRSYTHPIKKVIRPLDISRHKEKEKIIIKFKKPQLHTGHPQTSAANTITVSKVGTFAVKKAFQADDEEDFLVKFTQTTKDCGMLWKIQKLSILHGTFHKGFWVSNPDPFNIRYPHDDATFKGQVMHLWLPLPSCIVKMTKCRVNTPCSEEQILLRIALNCFQRLLTPQCYIVYLIARRHFEFLIKKLCLEGKFLEYPHAFISYFLKKDPKWFHYSVTQSSWKDQLSFIMNPTEFAVPLVNTIEQDAFFTKRYGLVPDYNFWSEWDGSICESSDPFFMTAFTRDYGCDSDSELFDAMSKILDVSN